MEMSCMTCPMVNIIPIPMLLGDVALLDIMLSSVSLDVMDVDLPSFCCQAVMSGPYFIPKNVKGTMLCSLSLVKASDKLVYNPSRH